MPESLDRGRAQVVEQQVGVRTWDRGFDPAVRLLARDQQNEPEAVKKESSIWPMRRMVIIYEVGILVKIAHICGV